MWVSVTAMPFILAAPPALEIAILFLGHQD